jgi:predicted DNA-binding transcriptional regulator YafY
MAQDCSIPITTTYHLHSLSGSHRTGYLPTLREVDSVSKRRGGQSSASSMLRRQWQLLLAIQGSRAGIRVARLVEETGLARASIYRDLKRLEKAGVPIHVEAKNGERRYRFLRSSELPPMDFNALQIAALHLARQQLEPLAGAPLVRELDALLEKLRPHEPQQAFRFAASPPGRPEVLKTVESALRCGRRARIEYRAASRNGVSTSVHIEPLLLNVAEGEPYLLAYCVERDAERTYKLARIAEVELTADRSTYRPKRAPSETFAHSVKAWSGELSTVRIRLDPEVAWRAQEYPLVPDQKIEKTARDGSVVVEARVAGIVEATQWVLSWGGAAEALEPEELRSAIRAELAKALGKYDGPGPVKAAGPVKAGKRKSVGGEGQRLTRGEKRRA